MSDEQARIRREFIRQEKKVKPELSKKTANAFNLAACCLPVIYNLIYKRYHLAVTFLILTLIPHLIDIFITSSLYLLIVILLSVFSILLALYSGFTGNSDAYNARNYDDERDFLFSQRGWKYAAVVAIIVHIAILNIQITGHMNTAKMIDFANAKDELKTAITDASLKGEVLGLNAIGDKIPEFFSKYINGEFDKEQSVIYSKSGYTYLIEGYYQDCLGRNEVNYHEKLTACAKILVDVNGKKGPNELAVDNGVDGVKDVSKNFTKLKDIFVLYAYNDDLAPKEGSVEQYILRKFERK